MVKKFNCKICNKRLSFYSVKNHLKMHGLNKIETNCYICNKKISSNSLFKHLKKHEEEDQKNKQKNENDEMYQKYEQNKEDMNQKQKQKAENEELDDNIKKFMESVEEKFTICGNTIYSNIHKDKIVRELDESILKLQYFKKMILNGKFVIKNEKENENEKYQYKFTKKLPNNKVPNFNIKTKNIILNNNYLFN